MAVFDYYSCTVFNETVSVGAPAILSAAGSEKDVSCFDGQDGSVSAIVSGGTTPYTFSWSNGSTASGISGQAIGNYSFTVTDAHGCMNNTNGLILQPSLLTDTISDVINVACFGNTNGGATVTGYGGTIPIPIPGLRVTVLQARADLAAANYSVTVTDAKGCTATSMVGISSPPAMKPT